MHGVIQELQVWKYLLLVFCIVLLVFIVFKCRSVSLLLGPPQQSIRPGVHQEDFVRGSQKHACFFPQVPSFQCLASSCMKLSVA